MSRIVRVATVQPPAPADGATPDSIQARGLELLALAAADGADIVCLPEYLNCMACGPDEAAARAAAPARQLVEEAAACARKHRCYIIASTVIETAGKRYNRTHVINREGKVTGHYDKVHITRVEGGEWKVTAGDTWPVFDCDFGRIGIITCYDGCFLEPVRILALRGAEIVFWPSLQRTYTETELSIQTRAHAYFNCVTVVRSSYGTERAKPWQPGVMVGMSCICGPDGNILANLGRWAGWTSAVVDLDEPQRGSRSYQGEVGIIREMWFADRRPETYDTIVETGQSDSGKS